MTSPTDSIKQFYPLKTTTEIQQRISGGIEEMNLTKGRRYLFDKKWPSQGSPFELTILEISKLGFKAANILGDKHWRKRKDFESEHDLLEDLGKRIKK